MLAYFPAFRADFVWDDESITKNPLLENAAGLRSIWFHPALNDYEEHYWPLVYTTFWLERKLWGLHPLGYHAVNVILHAINAILLGLLLRRLSFPAPWLAAGFFALHPIHVESVAWAIERKDVLSGLFFLLAARLLVSSMGSAGSPVRRRLSYVIALLCFACAMLSKSVTVGFPLVVALWLWNENSPGLAGAKESPTPIRARSWIRLIPFLLIAVCFVAVDLHLVRQREAELEVGSYGPSLFEKAFIAARVPWFYIGKLLWPAQLLAVYPKWEINFDNPLLSLLFIFSVLALAAAMWQSRCRQAGIFPSAMFFYLVMLGPALGLLNFSFMRYSYVADRFAYLASIGPTTLLAGCLRGASGRIFRFKPWSATGIQAFVLAGMGCLTWRQSGFYRNIETLFAHSVAGNPGAWVAHYNLGNYLADHGNYGEAARHYYDAFTINADHLSIYVNLGNALLQQKKTDGALTCFQRALKINPHHAGAHNGMGMTLAKQDKLEDAAREFAEAVRIRPRFAEAHNNLGIVLTRMGKLDDAIGHFQTAVALKPDYEHASHNLREAVARRDRAIKTSSGTTAVSGESK